MDPKAFWVLNKCSSTELGLIPSNPQKPLKRNLIDLEASTCLCKSSARLMDTAAPGFYVGAGDLNLGPYAFDTSILLTGPPPQCLSF